MKETAFKQVFSMEVIMDKTRVKRLLAAFFLIYWIFVVGIYLIANEQFRYSARES